MLRALSQVKNILILIYSKLNLIFYFLNIFKRLESFNQYLQNKLNSKQQYDELELVNYYYISLTRYYKV